MLAKHIYIYVIAIFVCRLLASCEADTPEDENTGAVMTFAVSDRARATATSSIYISDPRFAIFGDMKFKDNAPIKVFDNTIVEFKISSWSYDNPRCWYPQHEHSFIAMHPVEAAGISSKQYSASRLSFKYILPDDYKSATDLMLATHRRIIGENSEQSASSIALKFDHVMSKIDFRLTNNAAADIVKVTKIVLKGINKKGSFSIIPANVTSGDRTDDYELEWSDVTEKVTLEADINVNVNENRTESLFPDSDALFMIPQPDNNDVVVEITYEQWDDGVKFEEHTVAASATIGGWKQGKAYTYSMTVSEITKEIYLTVSVKDWQGLKNNAGISVPEY